MKSLFHVSLACSDLTVASTQISLVDGEEGVRKKIDVYSILLSFLCFRAEGRQVKGYILYFQKQWKQQINWENQWKMEIQIKQTLYKNIKSRLSEIITEVRFSTRNEHSNEEECHWSLSSLKVNRKRKQSDWHRVEYGLTNRRGKGAKKLHTNFWKLFKK